MYVGGVVLKACPLEENSRMWCFSGDLFFGEAGEGEMETFRKGVQVRRK